MVRIWPFTATKGLTKSQQKVTSRPADGLPINEKKVIGVDQLPSAATVPPVVHQTSFDGEKYYGGFGPTEWLWDDLPTLRLRSIQLFKKNPYARGLIRRLITNEINKGLQLEATPDASILGIDEDQLEEWAEGVENRFIIWSKEKRLVDKKAENDLSGLEKQHRMMSLVEGDVLVILRSDKRTGLPMVQLVSGHLVQTPFAQPNSVNKDHTIEHGVELDKDRRHVAYWIIQAGGGFKRIPAYGRKSGRRQAWLSYGTDKLMDDVRGVPLLGLIMQSMNELDRYKDASLRKAVLNAMVAMAVEKGENKIGSKAASRAAAINQKTQVSDSDGNEREFQVSKFAAPGLIFEELQHGEKLQVHSTAGTDVNYGAFEEAALSAIAWANEIPPSILTLGFSSNYSASQGEIKELKMYLDKVRPSIAGSFNQPIYQEWLLVKVALGDIRADGLLRASQSIEMYETYGAWVSSDWSGAIKPSTDILKETKGYLLGVQAGALTRDRMSKETHGTKFSHNVKRLKKENEQLVEAFRPIWEAQQEFGDKAVSDVMPSASTPHAEDFLIDEGTGEPVVVRDGEVVPLLDEPQTP